MVTHPPTLVDDIGAPVHLARPPVRIVSLVPSLTEAIAAAVRDRLVGATDWCTHPPDLAVTRVRGTKNPDLAAIRALCPDLVVVNKEENRRIDVDRLRAAGIDVWATVIESVSEAFMSLSRLFPALGVERPTWLTEAESVWAEPTTGIRRRAVVAIWRDPWMVVGSRTFTGDVVRRLGLTNVFGDHAERYPHVSVDEIRNAQPDLILLPDEPYRFTREDGPEVIPGEPCSHPVAC